MELACGLVKNQGAIVTTPDCLLFSSANKQLPEFKK